MQSDAILEYIVIDFVFHLWKYSVLKENIAGHFVATLPFDFHRFLEVYPSPVAF